MALDFYFHLITRFTPCRIAGVDNIIGITATGTSMHALTGIARPYLNCIFLKYTPTVSLSPACVAEPFTDGFSSIVVVPEKVTTDRVPFTVLINFGHTPVERIIPTQSSIAVDVVRLRPRHVCPFYLVKVVLFWTEPAFGTRRRAPEFNLLGSVVGRAHHATMHRLNGDFHRRGHERCAKVERVQVVVI